MPSYSLKVSLRCVQRPCAPPSAQSSMRSTISPAFLMVSLFDHTPDRHLDASLYNSLFHLLESLSTVKSVVLVCDLPQADELMVQVFRDFFGLVRQDLAKNVEMFMADILVALIDECQSLPNDVLESIMAQFMDKNSVSSVAYCLCSLCATVYSCGASPQCGTRACRDGVVCFDMVS